jgi:hypothetical protein
MSRQIFIKNGVSVTSFCMRPGVIGFQVTWGWKDGEFIQFEDRKEAFIFAGERIQEIK